MRLHISLWFKIVWVVYVLEVHTREKVYKPDHPTVTLPVKSVLTINPVCNRPCHMCSDRFSLCHWPSSLSVTLPVTSEFWPSLHVAVRSARPSSARPRYCSGPISSARSTRASTRCSCTLSKNPISTSGRCSSRTLCSPAGQRSSRYGRCVVEWTEDTLSNRQKPRNKEQEFGTLPALVLNTWRRTFGFGLDPSIKCCPFAGWDLWRPCIHAPETMLP